MKDLKVIQKHTRNGKIIVLKKYQMQQQTALNNMQECGIGKKISVEYG